MHYGVVYARIDKQLAAHSLLARRGQLRHGDQQRASAVGTREALQGGFHHIDGARSVKIAHIHIQMGQDSHRFLHRIGNIVQLEVEENLVSARLDLAHDRRALGIIKFHADLYERFAIGEFVEERQRRRRAAEIACDYYISMTHCYIVFLILLYFQSANIAFFCEINNI